MNNLESAKFIYVWITLEEIVESIFGSRSTHSSFPEDFLVEHRWKIDWKEVPSLRKHSEKESVIRK